MNLATRASDGSVIIRVLAASDSIELHDVVVRNIDHLRAWMWWAGDEPITPAERLIAVNRRTQDWKDGVAAQYGIFFFGNLVGDIGLYRRQDPDRYEVGYWLDNDRCGLGIATRAVRLVCQVVELAGSELPLQILVDRANVTSALVAERAGFEYIKRVPAAIEAVSETGVQSVYQWMPAVVR